VQRSEARLSPSFFPRTAKRIEPGASAQQEPSGSMSAKGPKAEKLRLSISCPLLLQYRTCIGPIEDRDRQYSTHEQIRLLS